MNVVIREAGLGDEHRLAAVGAATFLESYAGVLTADDILSHCAVQHAPTLYEDWLIGGEIRLWLAEAEAGGAPVGFVAMTPPDLPLPGIGPGDAEIRRIYVLHRVQGDKVGWRLMKTALDAARRTGRKRMLVGVYGQNHAAIAFYKRVGFTVIGERKFKVGQTLHDDLVLALDLSEWVG
ncbi:MAG TPA: GNAT family N-acetyltransferase [Alphaproteobacteria bacterium]|jgi:ribosomal protein S18 acetylase RimI-like enzyme|nr:GNAT family N-acetyltransferase [Alphaproteobacteria bacterium]